MTFTHQIILTLDRVATELDARCMATWLLTQVGEGAEDANTNITWEEDKVTIDWDAPFTKEDLEEFLDMVLPYAVGDMEAAGDAMLIGMAYDGVTLMQP